MKFFNEFKEFIAKGNAIDMAVGVVIGGAFTSIVNSLVKDILTPLIALVTKFFASSAASVTDGKSDALLNMSEWTIPATEIKFGAFIEAVISFLMIAFVLFCIVKTINTMRDKLSKKEEPVEVVSAPTQEELLAEIRDLLKDKID
ncbi:MAG: large conductance mechanosensitive channel protein MscL [Clostridia bacterium]|nr:large conductance mechanosensitive channel protein MscL [Clostridia bacterium]MCI8979700.1 large conductance mechanosensitive channel protein MscL [Clostridia bacterium]